MVVIRWNPDTYKHEKGVKKHTREQRLDRLRDVVLDTLANPGEGTVKLLYMYYDEDNPQITQGYEHEHIEI